VTTKIEKGTEGKEGLKKGNIAHRKPQAPTHQSKMYPRGKLSKSEERCHKWKQKENQTWNLWRREERKQLDKSYVMRKKKTKILRGNRGGNRRGSDTGGGGGPKERLQ